MFVKSQLQNQVCSKKMIINTRYSVFISKAPQWNMCNCQTLNIYSPASRRALTDRGYTPGFFSVIIFLCHTPIYLFTTSPITLNNSLRIHLLTTVWTLSLFWVFICPSPIPPPPKKKTLQQILLFSQFSYAFPQNYILSFSHLWI